MPDPIPSELAPCPFCGSQGEVVERHNPMSKWRWSVDCRSSTCGMSGPVEATKADAIAAWNKRYGFPGWVVGNSDRTRWRTWASGMPEWTTEREQAARYARREDAEAVHAEDNDAWRVEPFFPEQADA